MATAGLTVGLMLPSLPVIAANQHAPEVVERHTEHLPAPILSLDFARDSDLAAAALSNGRVRIWHLDTGEIQHEFGFSEPETDQRQKDEGDVEPIRVRFSPDGKTLAISYLGRIHLYVVGIWSELKSLGVEGEDVMRSLALPRLTARPASEREPDDIDTGTKKWAQRKTLGDGRTRITDFAFVPDGSAIVASYCRISCYDRPDGVNWVISNGHEPIRLWKLQSGQMGWEHYSDKNQIIQRTIPSPDGRLLAEVAFQPGRWNLHFRDLTSGEYLSSIALRSLPHHPPDVAFMPDSHRFVSLWSEPHKMWQMAMFDRIRGQALDHFTDPSGAQHVAISPDGAWLAATTWRRPHAFKLWDLQQRRSVATRQPQVTGVRLRMLDEIRFIDSRRIAVSDYSKGVVWTYDLDYFQ